ncbi:MAG: hypothetical protein ABJF88_11710 [Rhodothermales bacterium]
MSVQPTARSLALEAVAEELARSLLPENPFPTSITSCNSAVVGRFGEWVEAQRARVEADLGQLRGRDESPEAWELSALAGAVREWRVFAAFHRLHEERWCPALLFRLATKTDLLVLCDPSADSSPSGFGEREKRVLAKRGIDHRLKWIAARQLVAAMGLLEAAVPDPEGAEPQEYDGATPAVDVAGDGALGAAEVAVVVAADVRAEEAATEEPPAAESVPEAEPSSEETPPERASGETLPPLRLNRVWSALPTYTKKQLEAVHERSGVGLWSQFGERFYSSMRKAEMLEFVQRVVRHHACLDAAQHLTDCQLDELHDWMRFNLTERYQRDEDLRIAARLFGDFLAGAALSRDGHGLSPEAWNRYRKAEIRRIAAFCYHRFYEAASTEGARPETAEVALD